MDRNKIKVEIKRLQNKVDSISRLEDDKKDSNDITKIRDEIIKLKQDINQVSNGLTSYDLEHYTEDIRSLLKIVQKQMLVFTDHSKRNDRKIFHLKRKPRFGNVLNDKKTSSGFTTLNSITTKTVNEKVVISDNVTILQNLENCQISVNSKKYDNSKDLPGAITLSQVNKSRIVLTDLPFTQGNIFIADCIDSIIIVQVPPKDTIQLRLHNLVDCKIKIFWKEPIISEIDKQTVIVENIKNCLFDLRSKSFVNIQNFSNINQSLEEDTDYQFGEFDF